MVKILFGTLENVKYICQIEQHTLHLNFTTMNKIQQDLPLLPRTFKKVAFGILFLTVSLIVLSKLDLLTFEKEIVKAITKTGLLISLLLFVLTRNKIEDELTLRIRLKAFTSAFIYGVLIVIIKPFINFLFGDSFLSDIDVYELLLSMFFFYFFTIFLMKKNR